MKCASFRFQWRGLRYIPFFSDSLAIYSPHGLCTTSQHFTAVAVPGFVVNEDVFGGQGFVNGLSPFPSDVVVHECIGNHEVALARLRPAKMPLATYAFRIRVQNPPNPPTLNTWSLTVASEASELFNSFDLWQIQDGTFLSSSVPAFGNTQEARNWQMILLLFFSQEKRRRHTFHIF